eukprot:TRINITY_DN39302_c0_g1_i1.p1 TRINITY_DN39302_c0_g1~~TRINITY_DN39302_c0_g1_i1.p1  ORF type:complete len:533 (+),score=116.21 TRINITY_DN39302_c0_g1_i1:113-1711(+)
MGSNDLSNDVLVLQCAMRQALRVFLPGDVLASESLRGTLCRLHEDRSATLECGKDGGSKNEQRLLLRDLSLCSLAPLAMPKSVVSTGEMQAVQWEGQAVVHANGKAVNGNRQQRADWQEGVHHMMVVASSQPMPEDLRVVGLSFSVEGMDQGWGNTGDAGVNVCVRSSNPDLDRVAIAGVVFDRRRSPARHHSVNIPLPPHAAPAAGDRLEVVLKSPNYPGWRGEITEASLKLRYEREETITSLEEPLPEVVAALGGELAIKALALCEEEFQAPPEAKRPKLDAYAADGSALQAAAAASFKLLWERLSDDSLLSLDMSHMSMSGMERHGALLDPKKAKASIAKLPQAVPRVHALIRKTGRPTELGKAMRLVERLEQLDPVGGAPPQQEARELRYRQILASISETLDALEAAIETKSPKAELVEAVLDAYADAEPHCLYRWERDVQMSHDLVCDEKTGMDAQGLEDIILARLHARRRRLVEAMLHKTKGSEATSDMHFERSSARTLSWTCSWHRVCCLRESASRFMVSVAERI